MLTLDMTRQDINIRLAEDALVQPPVESPESQKDNPDAGIFFVVGFDLLHGERLDTEP